MAGRRQHRQRERLPKYVYLAKGRYIYIPFQDGRRGKERVLCMEGAPLKDVWIAYEAITRADATGTLRWLSEQYLASPVFAKKAERTRRDYRRYHDTIMQVRLDDGRLFGEVRVEDITPGVIVKYHDKRQDTPITCNREMAYLSLIFSWACKRELINVTNPVKGAERHPEQPRERYPEDWEYQLVYDLAAGAPHYVRPAMEMAYLCRLRKIEVLTFKRKDLIGEGAIARRRKGSRTQIVTWSDRLRAAVAACAGASTVASVFVIHNRRGQPILESTFDSAWQRLMVRASTQGLDGRRLDERFTFHDIKAKGVSDFDGDKQRAAGHRTARAAAIYDRKVEQIKPTK